MVNGNGSNGTKKIFYNLIIPGVILAFLCFTSYRIYIHAPECYATKAEVKELKSDLVGLLNSINGKLDALMMKHVEDAGGRK